MDAPTLDAPQEMMKLDTKKERGINLTESPVKQATQTMDAFTIKGRRSLPETSWTEFETTIEENSEGRENIETFTMDVTRPSPEAT